LTFLFSQDFLESQISLAWWPDFAMAGTEIEKSFDRNSSNILRLMFGGATQVEVYVNVYTFWFHGSSPYL